MTLDPRWDKPQRMEFREFVIVYLFSEDQYCLEIMPNLAYLFKSTSGSDGTRPGWLAALRYNSIGEALVLGEKLRTIVRNAHDAQVAKLNFVKELTDLVYAEYGSQQKETP